MHILYFQRIRLLCHLDFKVTNQFTIKQKRKSGTKTKSRIIIFLHFLNKIQLALLVESNI